MTRIDPTTNFIDLAPGGRARLLPLDADFWPALAEGRLTLAGRLVSTHDMKQGVAHWERHPAGEELLIAISGTYRIEVEQPADRRETTVLAAGEVFLVAPGLWHRVGVETPGRLMFITPGEGTEHRP